MGRAAPLHAYWGCEPGLEFEVVGEKVRCVRAAQTLTGNPPHCPAGSTLRQDLVGNSDRCQQPNGHHVAPGCDANYSIVARPGADACQRHMPPVEKAPTMNVP
jgi:hypothetical protein